jgi:hypothetical protein
MSIAPEILTMLSRRGGRGRPGDESAEEVWAVRCLREAINIPDGTLLVMLADGSG